MGISEKLLHHIWKYKLLPSLSFTTIKNESITVLKVGEHNHDAGPDFFNGQITYEGKTWAGNIEMHIKTSDWIKHKHETNPAYDNVILHVVYENDLSIEKQPTKNIPVITLKQLIPTSLITKYQFLLDNKNEIPCGSQLKNISDFIVSSWLQRLLVGRLEKKLDDIETIFHYCNKDYQETLYHLIAGNFGFKINKDPFIQLARSMPLSILAKHKHSLLQIEALLFGQAGMLDDCLSHPYFTSLQNEYAFLAYKYQLKPLRNSIWKYLRLRPANFPALRIAQLSAFIHQSEHLFSKIIHTDDLTQIAKLFNVSASPYWHHHYTFDSEVTCGQPNLGKDSIENILINTVAPMLFFYGRQNAETHYETKAINLLESLHPESNQYIESFNNFGVKAKNASDSQALIQLFTNYCTHKKCLNCNIGHNILRDKSLRERSIPLL
jgi:Protein of unknown function (DUF2851)